MSQIVDDPKESPPDDRIDAFEIDGRIEALRQTASGQEPIGYLTTHYLAALWNERCHDVDAHRRTHADDLRGIEFRQRRASQALQAYRLLTELEYQLGFEVALPVLGPCRAPARHEPDDAADLID